MPKQKSLSFDVTDALSLVRECLTVDYFRPWDGKIAIPASFIPGKGKLLVAVGDNATGKSFFRRIVQSVCKRTGIECIHLSMEARRNIAYNPGLAFVYGSEDYQSTGVNSANTVLGAIQTSKDRENRHVIFWDEPDIGLSDDWSASAGVEIKAFMEAAPGPLVAAVVVTHNKALLRQLLPLNPHFLHFGEDPPTSLSEWLEKPIRIRPLSELEEEGHRRFRLIQSILKGD